jgi:hypothetical protein
MFGYMNKMAPMDKIVSGTWKDFAELANRWYREESGLIAKATPFIDKSIIERALAGEPKYRRLLEDIRRTA